MNANKSIVWQHVVNFLWRKRLELTFLRAGFRLSSDAPIHTCSSAPALWVIKKGKGLGGNSQEQCIASICWLCALFCDIWGQSGASCLSWFTVNKDLSVSALQFWLTGNNERGRVPPPLVLTAFAGAQTDPPPSHLQVMNRKAVQLAVLVTNTARILPVSVHLPQLWKTMAVSKLSFAQLKELFERNIIVLVSAGFGILCLLRLPCSFQSGWRWHGWAKPAQLSSHPLTVSSSLQVMVKPIPVLHLPSWWCLTCHHQLPELVHSSASVWSFVKQIRNT